MSILSALQCFGAFMAYLVVTLFVPSIVFGKRFRKLDVIKRFMLYFTIGNFFIMNLVFLLALLHITNKFTLLLGTIIPSILVYAKNNNISVVKRVREWSATFSSIVTGRLGIKTALYRFFSRALKGIAVIGRMFKEVFILNIFDWVLLGCFTLVFLKLFATNFVTNFGYPFSDLPVHNYWINYLGRNQIFVAGIYPFGFHCIMYYLHEVFGIDTYVLLRVFCVVQTFFVNIMIFTVLKSCCKTKFTPYIAMFGYMALNVFSINSYQRFIGTLPQEFGVIFIYPCTYFAFEFFRERKKELELEKYIYGNAKERRKKRKQERASRKKARKNGEKLKKKYFRLRVKESYSTVYLVGFAMSFSMTLAVHFYGVMVSGLFAVGLAVGYLFRFIRPKYFLRVVSTCAISVFVAVLPMVIAFAMGTPLQGSLGWGMNILTGGKSEANKKKPENETVSYVTTGNAIIPGSYVSGDGSTVSGVNVSLNGQAGVSGEASVNASQGSVGPLSQGAVVSSQGMVVSSQGAVVSSQGTTELSQNSAELSQYAAESSQEGTTLMYETGEGISAIVSGDVVYYINEMPMPLYFDRIGFVKMKKIHSDGVLNLIKKGNHYFYNTDELKYKRSISFYINLLKTNPDKFKQRIMYLVQSVSERVVKQTRDKVFVEATIKQVEMGYIIALVLMAVGLVYIIIGHSDYGAAIVSVVAFMICMALLLTAGRIGLPTLMDSLRASIYYAYMTPLVFALVIDVCIYTLFGWLKWKWVKWVKHIVSLIVLVAFVIVSYKYDYIKEPVMGDYLETNEAITCLTNIIRDEEDFKWTIVSANDETRMGEDHGYHFETIDFLSKMEGAGDKAMITIPTETVYFFIEKVPINYTVPYDGSGQKVSEKGAANYLPSGSGISVYKAKNRWIVMSRMYYWAQEFQKLYPNEMKVYIETDNFICYRIEQNTYRLYNFAIDYSYNTELYKYLDENSENQEDNK